MCGWQFCFNISSGDANSTQNTFIDWDYSIPGATFTTYPGTRETATFCWTPTSAQISSNPYCLLLLFEMITAHMLVCRHIPIASLLPESSQMPDPILL
ncbi:MAG: hypothetical protein IPN88_19230 [Bacteroidetes bacterium]|nr:hypothetical protein [Bacteroidota bacterium]